MSFIRKIQILEKQSILVKRTTAGVCLQNTYDYSPFGVSLDGRTLESDFYRRGFNGMEKDDEFKGKGNSYTTEFRQLEPRLGRWLIIDPLFAKFPWQSSYASFDNNPVYFNDPLGSESKGNGDPPGLPDKRIDASGKSQDWVKGDTFKDTNGDTWLLTEKEGEKVKWNKEIIVSLTKNSGQTKNLIKFSNVNNSYKNFNLKAPWMSTALNEFYNEVKEVPFDSNSGPRVDEYLKSAGVSSPNAWCAAFVHWCLAQNGIKGAGASGNNYKNWGYKLEKPIFGAIAIFKSGHVGFYIETMPNGNYKIIHGNWSSQVILTEYTKPNEINFFVFPN